jgi:hypothetical protein
MKIIFIILSVLAAIVALLLIIAIFVRKTYSVEQEITIQKSRQYVFNYIKYLKNQDNFSVRATNAYMITQSVSGDQTNVKWGFESEMKYPMNLMLLFMNMENMVGKDLSIGLSNLKSVLEKNP